MNKPESQPRYECVGQRAEAREEPSASYLGAGALQPQQLGQVVAGRVIDGVLEHLHLLHQRQVIVVRCHLRQDTTVLRAAPDWQLPPRRKRGSGSRQSRVRISPPQPKGKGSKNSAKGRKKGVANGN